MMNFRSIGRMGLVAVAAVAVSGCCVLPPHGWRHGHRHGALDLNKTDQVPAHQAGTAALGGPAAQGPARPA